MRGDDYWASGGCALPLAALFSSLSHGAVAERSCSVAEYGIGGNCCGRLPKPMGALMVDDFIERQNIAKFTNLLLQETDTAKRQLLQRLLTDEMVRQANLSKPKPIE